MQYLLFAICFTVIVICIMLAKKDSYFISIFSFPPFSTFIAFSILIHLNFYFCCFPISLIFFSFPYFCFFFFPISSIYHTLLHFFHNFLIIFIFPLFFSDSHPSSLVCPASRCCCPYQKLVSSF